VITLPQIGQLADHPLRAVAEPAAIVDRRVGAEVAAEAAALGGDVVKLALAFEPEIFFDGDEVVVVAGEGVDVAQRARGGDD
jgi:hypothetical protein